MLLNSLIKPSFNLLKNVRQASSFARLTLVGNIGSEPEFKSTKNGKDFARLDQLQVHLYDNQIDILLFRLNLATTVNLPPAEDGRQYKFLLFIDIC